MPKTILLHIGTRKTGTTSIQEALAGARSRLAPVCYPLVKDDRNHNRLITLYLPHEQLPPHWREAYPLDDRRFRKMRRRYRRSLFDQLAAANSAIISAEALSSFFTPSAAEQLRRDLESAGFVNFHVILYVRDPADYFLSYVQQVLKSTSGTAPKGPHPASFKYELRRMAETWEQVFPGSVVLRRFPGNADGDVVQDFSAAVEQFFGLALPSIPARMNRTISAEGMQILQKYRLAFWPNNGGVLTPDAAELVRFLAQSDIDQTEPVLQKEVAAQIRANHKADADFIFARYGVDLGLSDVSAGVAPEVDRTYLVDDLIDCVDPEVVQQLLLRFAKTELAGRASRISLSHRIASRVYRAMRT